MATLHAAERVRVGCGSEPGAFAHEFRKVAVDDAVALLDGIVAREDVLGVVVAKWQVKGVKLERLLKNTPLTREFAPRRPSETLKLRVSAQKFKAFSHIDRKAVVLGFDDVVEKVVSLKNARLMGDAVVAPRQEGARAGRHAGEVAAARRLQEPRQTTSLSLTRGSDSLPREVSFRRITLWSYCRVRTIMR